MKQFNLFLIMTASFLFFSPATANEWKKIIQSYGLPVFKINRKEIEQKSNSEINWELKKQGLNYLKLVNNDYQSKIKIDYELISSSWHTEQIKKYIDNSPSFQEEDLLSIEKKINYDIEKTLQGLKEYDLAISLHRVYTIEKEANLINESLDKHQRELISLKKINSFLATKIDNLVMVTQLSLALAVLSLLGILVFFFGSKKVRSKYGKE